MDGWMEEQIKLIYYLDKWTVIYICLKRKEDLERSEKINGLIYGLNIKINVLIV